MALREQIQAFRFVGGVDTRTDPFAVTPTKLAIAENCSFASTGRVRKLPGFAALSRDIAGSDADLGESIANGGAGPAQALMPYRGELLAADLSRLYSYDVGSAQWIDKGRLASINVTKNAVNADTFDNYGQDGAVHSGGLQCYLWNGYNDGLYYAVLDTVTGQLVVRGTLITTTGTRGRVLVSGNTFFLMYYDTSATTLKFATLAVGAPTATLSFSALTTSTADANGISNSAPNYDATLITSASAGAQLYIAFNNRLAGGGLSLWRSAVSTPTANVAKVSITGEVASNAITVFEDRFGNLPVLAYYNGSAVLFRVYDPRLADASNVPILVADGIVETIANVTSITGASASATATDVRFYYTISAASAANYYVRTATWVGAYVIDPTWWFMHGAAPWSMIDASASAADFLRSVMLAAKAFVYGDQVYVPLVHDSAEQPTYFVADGARNIVARFLAGSAGGVIPVSASAVQSLPSVTTADATTFRLALRQERIVGPSLAAPPVATICPLRLPFFDPPLSYPRAELAQNLHVGGGFSRCTTASRSSSTDSTCTRRRSCSRRPEAHTYQYTACYEWTDNEGNPRSAGHATGGPDGRS